MLRSDKQFACITYTGVNVLVSELVSWCDIFKDPRLKIGVSMTKEGLRQHPCIHGTHTQIEKQYSQTCSELHFLCLERCVCMCVRLCQCKRERENLCPFILKKMEGFFKGIILSIQLYAIEYKSVCTCHFSKKWSWRHQLELALWQRQILANVYMTVCLFCQSEAKQSNGIATVKFSLTRPDLKKTHNNRNSSVDSQN